jgi:hypothetical protein
MENNELRIGNFVRLNNPKYHPENTGKNFMIDSIKNDDVSLIDYENLPAIILYQYLKYIEPIELTEEWLLKFGAKWEGDYIFLEINKLTIRTHLPNMKPASIFAYFDGIKIKQLKYVHELQNLYYAINGTELKCEGF